MKLFRRPSQGRLDRGRSSPRLFFAASGAACGTTHRFPHTQRRRSEYRRCPTCGGTTRAVNGRSGRKRPVRLPPDPVGPRGDLAALLTQHRAGQLARDPLLSELVDERHDHRLRGSSSPAKKTAARRSTSLVSRSRLFSAPSRAISSSSVSHPPHQKEGASDPGPFTLAACIRVVVTRHRYEAACTGAFMYARGFRILLAGVVAVVGDG